MDNIICDVIHDVISDEFEITLSILLKRSYEKDLKEIIIKVFHKHLNECPLSNLESHTKIRFV